MEGGVDKGALVEKNSLIASGQMVLELMWGLLGKVMVYHFFLNLEMTIIYFKSTHKISLGHGINF